MDQNPGSHSSQVAALAWVRSGPNQKSYFSLISKVDSCNPLVHLGPLLSKWLNCVRTDLRTLISKVLPVKSWLELSSCPFYHHSEQDIDAPNEKSHFLQASVKNGSTSSSLLKPAPIFKWDSSFISCFETIISKSSVICSKKFTCWTYPFQKITNKQKSLLPCSSQEILIHPLYHLLFPSYPILSSMGQKKKKSKPTPNKSQKLSFANQTWDKR